MGSLDDDQMAVSALVNFEGDWTQTEQQVLNGAIADVEKLAEPIPQQRRPATPWLCYCKRLDGVSVYMAYRTGTNNVLYAYGAVELGLEILTFSAEDGKKVPIMA